MDPGTAFLVFSNIQSFQSDASSGKSGGYESEAFRKKKCSG